MSTYEDWFLAEYEKGVPEEYHAGLISEYSSRPEAAAVYDLVSGEDLTMYGAPADTLVIGFTEAGRAIKFGEDILGIRSMDATAHPFLMAQDHTFEAWLRVRGSGDQVIWTNQGASGYEQSLTYDATPESLVYTSVIGATKRTVLFPVETDRLYHVVVSRDYDGANTKMSLYLDGVVKVASTYAGAPVMSVTYDDLSIGSAGATDPLYGDIQGIRLYDEALLTAEVLALHDIGQARVEACAYATQTITATTLTTPVTGWSLMEYTATGDGSVDEDYEYAYPVFLYRRTVDDSFRALFVGGRSTAGLWSQLWQEIDELVDSVYEIRWCVKNTTRNRPSGYAGEMGESYFDLLAGGEASASAIISAVDIPDAKRQILEKIVMRNKPLHTWAGMVVRYV